MCKLHICELQKMLSKVLFLDLSTLYFTAVGAWVAHLVERAPIYRGSLLATAAAGLTPTCGHLLHAIPPLSPSFISSAVLYK